MTLEYPTIYLLPKGLDPGYMSELESQIPSLTYDIKEAEVVLGKLSQPERAKWELRTRQVFTEDIDPGSTSDDDSVPPAKRRRVSESAADNAVSTAMSDDGASIVPSEISGSSLPGDQADQASAVETADPKNIVKVVKLSWFLDCREKNAVLPFDNYVVYQGRKVPSPVATVTKPTPTASGIWERAVEQGRARQPASKWSSQKGYAPSSQHHRTHAHPQRPRLRQETTSEHSRALRMPPVPDFLHTSYSCQRPTRVDPPNAAFIKQLKEVRTIRTVMGDQTGERAYSTAISTLAAYPHAISCVPGKYNMPAAR